MYIICYSYFWAIFIINFPKGSLDASEHYID